jgi:hypothetical protein
MISKISDQSPMKQANQPILRKLAIGCIVSISLIVLGCIGVLGLLKYSVWQSEQSIDQTLASQIDPHFEFVLKVLSPAADDAVVTPPGVGILTSPGPDNIANRCGNSNDNALKSLAAIYSGKSNSNKIWMSATLCKNLAQGFLRDMAERHPCGPDLGGEYRLRETVANPYLYLVCTDLGGNGLRGITWANGNWLITVSGDCDSITQFLSDYPY